MRAACGPLDHAVLDPRRVPRQPQQTVRVPFALKVDVVIRAAIPVNFGKVTVTKPQVHHLPTRVVFCDIKLWRPLVRLWHQPESWPHALSARKPRADFNIPVAERELVVRRNHAGAVVVGTRGIVALHGAAFGAQAQVALFEDYVLVA